jgi:hypothetical protein
MLEQRDSRQQEPMNLFSYLVILVLVIAVVLLEHGLNPASMWVLLAFALLALIPLYFGTRDRTRPASSREAWLASAWVWIRRSLSFALGGLLIVGAGHTLFSPGLDKDFELSWPIALTVFALGVGIIFLGLRGAAHERDWKGSMRLHRENRKRYGWWF